MKIALVTQQACPLGESAPSASAGEGARVAGLAEALARLGHNVTVYARQASARPGRMQVTSGVTVEQVPAGPRSRSPQRPAELGPHIRDFGDHLAKAWCINPPDVAHAYFWTGGLAALAGARELGVRVVETFGSLGLAEQRHHLAGHSPAARVRLEASIARNVSAVLASSGAEVSELARMGVPSPLVSVLPCGVDTVRFSPEGPVAPRLSRPRLLAVGPVAERQGLDAIVRALTDVPVAELVIAGGPDLGRLRSDPTYQSLIRLATLLGVQDRVTFTGRIAPDELPALLRSADALVDAAWYEPVGQTALRAMACGTPVVAFAVGSHPDTIIDGTTGILVPPGRPDLLARQLRELIATPLQLAAFGIAAADRARSRYSWDRIGREALAAYDRSLARPAA